jgi:crotonobetainyl-CoA:carnitine CoA-transferase CaiB-like acyl-CoA transferase
LTGLNVVDLGVGMAAAMVSKVLAEAGASVLRLEPEMGDPFYEVYPAYGVWRRKSTIECVEKLAIERVLHRLHGADVCLVGGEDFPGFEWGLSPAAIIAENPRLVVLEIQASPGTAEPFPAVEILAQAASGIAAEHYSDRPICAGFAAASYGCALQGLVGLISAVLASKQGAPGQIVSASLFEGALTWVLPRWFDATRPSGDFLFELPKDPHPLVFRCADGAYVHLVIGSAGSKGVLYGILGIEDPDLDPNDSGAPSASGTGKFFFGDVDLLERHVVRHDSGELLETIWRAGLAGERVMPPGACWDDPQVAHNRIVERVGDGIRCVGSPLHGWVQDGRVLKGASSPDPARPLAGERVLDFGVFVAGPYGSAPLVDLGADVIKVEPIAGDPSRGVFRTFASANRGKRSIAVDMKTVDGAAVVARLCDQARVIINNFRPGVAARLNLDGKSIWPRNPSAIILEATGYGSDGPKGGLPGFDMIFQAFCGFEERGGGMGNKPLWSRATMIDYADGLLNAIGVLLALVQTRETGAGAQVHTTLLNTGIFLMSELIQGEDGQFCGAPPLNAAQTGYHPAEALYRTKDGWLAVAARSDAMASTLSAALGLRDELTKPRSLWAEPEAEALVAAFAKLTLADAMSILRDAGVWAVRCMDRGERLLSDCSAIGAGQVLCSAHDEFGQLRQVGGLFRLSGKAPLHSAGAPQLGADTRAILGELGYANAAIDDLYSRRVVA